METTYAVHAPAGHCLAYVGDRKEAFVLASLVDGEAFYVVPSEGTQDAPKYLSPSHNALMSVGFVPVVDNDLSGKSVSYVWPDKVNPVLSASFSGAYVADSEDKAEIYFISAPDELQEGTAWDLIGLVVGVSHPTMKAVRAVGDRLRDAGFDALTNDQKELFFSCPKDARELVFEDFGHRCGVDVSGIVF